MNLMPSVVSFACVMYGITEGDSTFWSSTTYLSCHLSGITVRDSDKVVERIHADLRWKRELQGGLDTFH